MIDSLTLLDAPPAAGWNSSSGPLTGALPLPSMRTRGGQSLVLRGNYFGPVAPQLPLLLQGRPVSGTGTPAPLPALSTSDCEVVGRGHDGVVCRTPPGIGSGYAWTLTVAGQTSQPSAQVCMNRW